MASTRGDLGHLFHPAVRRAVLLEHGCEKTHNDFMRNELAEQDIDLAKSWFYTDSVTDLPLLERVGHPVVTNPDPLLYRRAVQRRWPVRFFKAPDTAGGELASGPD